MNIDRQLGFKLGNWKVYPDQGLLDGANGQSHLEPKVMEVTPLLAPEPEREPRSGLLLQKTASLNYISSSPLHS